MHPVSCTNTHHGVTDLVNHGMVKRYFQNGTRLFYETEIFLACASLRWHILRSYRFVEVY